MPIAMAARPGILPDVVSVARLGSIAAVFQPPDCIAQPGGCILRAPRVPAEQPARVRSSAMLSSRGA